MGKILLGGWSLIPGHGMDKGPEVYVEDKSGRQIMDADVECNENFLRYLPTGPRHGWVWISEKIDEPGEYKIGATMDLGPVLGSLKKTISYKVEAEAKDD